MQPARPPLSTQVPTNGAPGPFITDPATLAVSEIIVRLAFKRSTRHPSGVQQLPCIPSPRESAVKLTRLRDRRPFDSTRPRSLPLPPHASVPSSTVAARRRFASQPCASVVTGHPGLSASPGLYESRLASQTAGRFPAPRIETGDLETPCCSVLLCTSLDCIGRLGSPQLRPFAPALRSSYSYPSPWRASTRTELQPREAISYVKSAPPSSPLAAPRTHSPAQLELDPLLPTSTSRSRRGCCRCLRNRIACPGTPRGNKRRWPSAHRV